MISMVKSIDLKIIRLPWNRSLTVKLGDRFGYGSHNL